MKVERINKISNLYGDYKLLAHSLEKLASLTDEEVDSISIGSSFNLTSTNTDNLIKYKNMILGAIKDDLMKIEKQLEEM